MQIEKNKKAYFDYIIFESLEAGVELKGGEVKSIRNGNVSLKDSFCHIQRGEVILKNCHIATYKMSTIFNENPRRDRRLLLHKKEIGRLAGKIKEKGFTLVPLKIYLKKGLIKLEIGLCKGKKLFDKKQALKEKDIQREAERALANYND